MHCAGVQPLHCNIAYHKTFTRHTIVDVNIMNVFDQSVSALKHQLLLTWVLKQFKTNRSSFGAAVDYPIAGTHKQRNTTCKFILYEAMLGFRMYGQQESYILIILLSNSFVACCSK